MIAAPTERVLPEEFEALERFVAKWSANTTDGRIAVRSESTMEEIRAFYDAMVPCAIDAVRFIDRHSIDDLPPDVGRLAQLVLSLPHAATAIEVIGAPRVMTAPYPNTVRVVRGSVPFG